MSLTHHPLPPGVAPEEAFRRLRGLPGTVLLESTDREAMGGGCSFVAADPFVTLSAVPGATTLRWTQGAEVRRTEPPLHVLRELLARFAVDPVTLPEGFAFPGGAAGWLGYELGGTLERLPPPRGHDPAEPLLELGLYDVVLGWDHGERRSWVVSTGFPEGSKEARRRRAGRRMETFLERLSDPAPPLRDVGSGESHELLRDGPPLHAVPGLPGVSSTFSPGEYREAVERIRRLILAGDVFQANLSQRFQTRHDGDPFELYRRVARSHPAPYAAYLETPDGAVVSASPECFLKVRGRRVETRPIKGTAPRSSRPEEDRELAQRLLESEKDRAENVMIVDLLRNDLSRVCEAGSVRASAVCALESHPTVHHLVSVVEGQLARGRGPVDLLEAAFPGGSITGAPKLRAMEILAELEPTPRGIYTGSLGWLGFDGSMELNIAIRTVRIRGGVAWVQAGGGIVLDSDPEAEWRETIEKVRGLLGALSPDDEQGGREGGSGRRGRGTSVGSGLPPEELPSLEAVGGTDAESPRVAVLDHRDSFVYNLARYLEELGARVRVFRADRASLQELEAFQPTHLVLSPGPCTPREFPLSKAAVRSIAGRVPIMGVCLGHLCIADALGGGWSPAKDPRHGKASEVIHDGAGILREVTSPFLGARYHSLALTRGDLPPGFRIRAWTEQGEIMAVEDPERGIWGLQFHPESVLTTQGRTLLRSFLRLPAPERPVAASTGAVAAG